MPTDKMKTEVIVAVIAAIVSMVSAAVSVYGQARIIQLTDQLARKRSIESQEAKTAALMSKYKDPLLRSAIDLQSRLYNIYRQSFLSYFFSESESAKNYAINNTLYVVAEYLGWVEILRREVQFLDLGESSLNRELSELLVSVNQAFSKGRSGDPFRLYNGEQRAIGEIMTVIHPIDQTSTYDCIGYAKFTQNMNDPEFASWFAKLLADIETMATASRDDIKRIAKIHSTLIDLIEFLDPNHIKFPTKYRTRMIPKRN